MKPVFDIVFFLIFAGLMHQGNSQTLFFQNNLQFKNYSVNEGLSQSTINCILQDSIGYMWFGTRAGGLNRFDGYSFKHYNRSIFGEDVLKSDEIICLAEGDFQYLFFGTEDEGVYLLDRQTEEINHFYLEESALCLYFEKSTAALWIGTNSGLFIKSVFIKNNPGGLRIINNEVVSSIVSDKDDNIFVATNKNLYVFNSNAQIIRKVHLETNVNRNSVIRNLCCTDRGNQVWISNGYGLWYIQNRDYDHIQNAFLFENIEGFDDVIVRGIISDTSDNIWIGTTRGLIKYLPAENQIHIILKQINNTNSLFHNSVYSLAEDKEGNVWAGTWSGISMISDKLTKFSHVRHIDHLDYSLSNNMVSSFAESEAGLWVGTEQGGLNLLDKKAGRFRHFKYSKDNTPDARDHIKYLFTDSRNNLWIGTFGAGVRKRNLQNGTEKYYLKNARIFSIAEFPENILWVGTISGLYKTTLSGDVLKIYNTDTINPGSLHNNFITCLYKSGKNKLWVGTRKGGVALYIPDIDDFMVFRRKNKNSGELESDYIICISEDNDGNIWIGTDFGLYCFDEPRQCFIKAPYLTELQNYLINGIVFDEVNNTWISTNNGVYKYDFKLSTLHKFKLSDGLQGFEFNRGAYFTSANGSIFFGGINGFNIIDPDDVELNAVLPEPVIKSIRTYNKTINLEYFGTKTLVLNHMQNDLYIEFAALSYINPEDNYYSYMLKGYQYDWSEPDKNRTVSYTNLSPGEYEFMLKVSNNDNVWNRDFNQVKLVIKPPYWKTNIAYIIYTVIAFVVLYLIRKTIIARQKQKMQLIYERNQKIQIQELNEMKLRYFTNISHEFRTPLTLIKGPLADLEKQLKEKPESQNHLKIINRNTNRLLNLINQLLDFRKVEKDLIEPSIKEGKLSAFTEELVNDFSHQAMERGVKLIYKVDDSDAEAYQWFDPYIIDKIIFNLLSNALKFTPENGEINVALKIDKNEAVIEVKDNGEGIGEEDKNKIFDRFYSSKNLMKHNFSGSGIGLALSKRLIEIHLGSIEVESRKGEGTRFILHFPVKRDDYASLFKVMADGEDKAGLSDIQTSVIEDNGAGEKHDHTILIIEDNKELRNYLKDIFKSCYHVKTADNGQDALNIVKDINIDLIISDIMMPKMDGLEFSRKIHHDMATSHIPVLFLTAKTNAQDVAEGLETGAIDYIIKPFNPDDLVLKTRNIIKNRTLIFKKIISSGTSFEKESNILSLDEKFLKCTYDAIHKSYSNPGFNIEGLCSQVNLSRSQLHRKFKALTGKSPSEVLTDVRLNKAKALIERKSMSISEAAYSTGYNNLSVFSQAFKNKFGINPSKLAGK
jgi:signal transduction histidine kinase/ligand-binding sensor domain-containing protein/DNA-binding response OmpR family regulator